MRRRHTPPAPLERGGLKVFFFIENEYFECCVSPLERGLKGCVMVRSVAWAEEFFEEGSVGLWVAVFCFRRQCADVIHPRPLSKRGVLASIFCLVMRCL